MKRKFNKVEIIIYKIIIKLIKRHFIGIYPHIDDEIGSKKSLKNLTSSTTT